MFSLCNPLPGWMTFFFRLTFYHCPLPVWVLKRNKQIKQTNKKKQPYLFLNTSSCQIHNYNLSERDRERELQFSGLKQRERERERDRQTERTPIQKDAWREEDHHQVSWPPSGQVWGASESLSSHPLLWPPSSLNIIDGQSFLVNILENHDSKFTLICNRDVEWKKASKEWLCAGCQWGNVMAFSTEEEGQHWGKRTEALRKEGRTKTDTHPSRGVSSGDGIRLSCVCVCVSAQWKRDDRWW